MSNTVEMGGLGRIDTAYVGLDLDAVSEMYIGDVRVWADLVHVTDFKASKVDIGSITFTWTMDPNPIEPTEYYLKTESVVDGSTPITSPHTITITGSANYSLEIRSASAISESNGSVGISKPKEFMLRIKASAKPTYLTVKAGATNVVLDTVADPFNPAWWVASSDEAITHFSFTPNDTTITEVEFLHADTLTNTYRAFSSATSLKRVRWNGPCNLVSTNAMFLECHILEEVPVFDMSHVTDLSWMFTGCKAITIAPYLELPVATQMDAVFKGCESLDFVAGFDTPSVTSFSRTFQDCINLERYPDVNIPNVSNFNNCFLGCTSLKTVGIINGGQSFVGTFKDCLALTCIGGIDTTGHGGGNTFDNNPVLVNPNPTEVAAINAGAAYLNANTCAPLTIAPSSVLNLEASNDEVGQITVSWDAPAVGTQPMFYELQKEDEVISINASSPFTYKPITGPAEFAIISYNEKGHAISTVYTGIGL